MPMMVAEGGRILNRGGRMIIVSAHGQSLIGQLIDGPRSDPAVARSLSANDADAEVVSTVFAALTDPANVRNHAT